MTSVTFCAYDKPDSVGGPVSWIRRLAPALKQRGIDVRCLFIMHWGETGPAVSALRDAGIPCAMATGLDTTEERAKWILERLRENPPGVFVPNLVVAAYYAARWAREAGISTIGVLHSDDPFYHGILDEFVFGPEPYRVSAVVCVSAELERAVLARQPPGVDVERIPYGVDLPGSRVEREPGKLRLAYVGRLAETQKRIGDVARALCSATAAVPGTDAVIYGDGPDRRVVESILDEQGRGLPVRLGGLVGSEAIQQRMLDADVIVLLSDYEGLPIALLEAMACGCVPICLGIRSGIPELVQDGVSGLLVADRDASFVSAVRRLRDDETFWKRLSDGARQSAERFSSGESADHWARFLSALALRQGRKLEVPDDFELPPVHPALASADRRHVSAPRPGIVASIRARVGRMRRRVTGGLPAAGSHHAIPIPANATIVRISGGLANQMLCYKLGRFVADLRKSPLVLDASPYDSVHADPARNFQLSRFPIRSDLVVTSAGAMRRIREVNDIEYVTREMAEDRSEAGALRLERFLASSGIVYCDLWLAFRFRERADEAAKRNGALSDLTLQWEQSFDPRDRNCLEAIRRAANSVAVHVRRGDFATHDGNILLTSRYYNEAISTLEARLGDPSFFVFSDDIPWCRQNLLFRNSVQFVDWHDDTTAFKDMFLASQCAHFILSNESTFSHQVVQLSRPHKERIVITSSAKDLERNSVR